MKPTSGTLWSHPSLPCKVSDPTAEELQAAIDGEYCWWCGATNTATGVEITSWAMHWSKAHGIHGDYCRDILGVTKATKFCSDEQREQMRRTYLAWTSPEDREKAMRASARKRRGKPRTTTKAGLANIKAATSKALKRMWREDRDKAMRGNRASVAANTRSDPTVPCDICGKRFWVRSSNTDVANRKRYCSTKCRRVGQSKLTPRDVRWILKASAAGASDREISNKFPVSRKTINNIRNGNYWCRIDPHEQGYELLWGAARGLNGKVLDVEVEFNERVPESEG